VAGAAKNELTVVMKAKDLCTYIVTATQDSPDNWIVSNYMAAPRKGADFLVLDPPGDRRYAAPTRCYKTRHTSGVPNVFSLHPGWAFANPGLQNDAPGRSGAIHDTGVANMKQPPKTSESMLATETKAEFTQGK